MTFVLAFLLSFPFFEKPVFEAHAAVEASRNSDEILVGDALLLKAARQAGLQDDSEFNAPAGNAGLVANARTHLTLRNDGQLVHVSFTAHDAEKAAGFANALVDAYNDEMESRGLARTVELSAGLDAIQAAIDVKEAALANPHLTPSQSRALIMEANRQRDLYDVMLMRAGNAQVGVTRFASRAVVPVEPTNANNWAGLWFGLPLCLMGGLVVAVSRRRLQDLPAPVAQLEVMVSPREISQPVVAVSNAGTGFIHPDTLLDYVENLLGCGNSVLIIDCELGGALTDSVGLRGEHGLTDFLLESPTLRGRIPAWKTNRDGVSVMPVGTRPNRIPVLLTGSLLRESLATLLAEFDRIVINAPPVLSTGEMRELSAVVNGVVLVAPAERSLELAHLATWQVEEFGGRVIGLVEDAPLVLH